MAGFIYEDIPSAKKAFEQVVKGFERGATKVSHTGNAAIGSLKRGSGTGELVFRRDATVVCIRSPATDLDDIVKTARKIDSRLGKAKDK